MIAGGKFLILCHFFSSMVKDSFSCYLQAKVLHVFTDRILGLIIKSLLIKSPSFSHLHRILIQPFCRIAGVLVSVDYGEVLQEHPCNKFVFVMKIIVEGRLCSAAAFTEL